MGRGVSSGGGQSSLGYLFGSAQPPNTPPLPPPAPTVASQDPPQRQSVASNTSPVTNIDTSSRMDTTSNNYHRAQGQNSGNFITDRPSTKVQSVPGGGSSLGYLFGSQK